MVEDALARLGSNREPGSIALVGARILRLGDHLRSVRLHELECDLLRRGDATQRDLVRSTLIVGDIEIDGLVRAGFRDRHSLEVASLVGRRRERHISARINGDGSVVNRTVDRLCRHLKALWLVRVIGLGVIRIVRVRNHRVGIDGLLLLFHRQRSGHDLDIEVRVGDRRADLVLASRRALIGIAGVLGLHTRSVNRTLQARGKRWVRLSLEALGVVNLHLELCRSDLELAGSGTDVAVAAQRGDSAVRAGIGRGLRRGILRASGTEVPDPKVALADLRGTGNFRRLRCAIKGIVAIRKRKYYVLCLDNERKAGSRGLATSIRARDIKGGNARLGRDARERQTARCTGKLEPVGELRLIPCVLVRSLAARGPGNRGDVRAVRTRCR